MAQKRSLPIPASSLRYALVCLGGLAAFFFIGIYPNMQSIKGLKQSIQELRVEALKQDLLQPVYQDLKARIENPPQRKLPFPKRTKLPRRQVGELTPVFEELAGTSGLKLISFVPDLNSLTESQDSFNATLQVQGDFFPLRDFLIELGRLAYVERIEELDLEAVRERRDVRIKLRIAVSGTGKKIGSGESGAGEEQRP